MEKVQILRSFEQNSPCGDFSQPKSTQDSFSSMKHDDLQTMHLPLVQMHEGQLQLSEPNMGKHMCNLCAAPSCFRSLEIVLQTMSGIKKLTQPRGPLVVGMSLNFEDPVKSGRLSGWLWGMLPFSGKSSFNVFWMCSFIFPIFQCTLGYSQAYIIALIIIYKAPD